MLLRDSGNNLPMPMLSFQSNKNDDETDLKKFVLCSLPLSFLLCCSANLLLAKYLLDTICWIALSISGEIAQNESQFITMRAKQEYTNFGVKSQMFEKFLIMFKLFALSFF